MSTANTNPWKKGIDTSAIVKAIQFLRSAKCNFFIMHEGQVVTDTFPKRADPTMPPPRLRQRVPESTVTAPSKKGPIRRTNNFVEATGYVEKVEAMVPN